MIDEQKLVEPGSRDKQNVSAYIDMIRGVAATPVAGGRL
ncbi:hypothetical protein ABIE41_004082 [Bosea sp. OAE506]